MISYEKYASLKPEPKPAHQPKAQVSVEIPEAHRAWSNFKIFDIAANLADQSYKGKYRGKKFHDADFDQVIARGNQYGVKKYLITATELFDAKDCLRLSLGSDDFYATIGVHPTRAQKPFKGRS